MRHLFHTNLFLLLVLALVGCGGDEPMPPIPEEPQTDTTQVTDTIKEDTTREDTLAEDTFTYSYIGDNSLSCYISSDVEDTEFSWEGRWDFFEDAIYFGKDESHIITASKKGYVSQSVLLHTPFCRRLDFVMQPLPASSLTVRQLMEAKEAIQLSNSVENREKTGMEVRLTFPEACEIDGAKDEEKVSVVALPPVATAIDNLEEGRIVSAAIGYFAVTPEGYDLAKKAHAQIAFPYQLDGYALKATMLDGWRIGMKTEGNTAAFDMPDIGEWSIEMEAKVADYYTEPFYIEKDETLQCTQKNFMPMLKLYYKGFGYEAESPLNDIEQVFLVSLFGNTEKNPYRTRVSYQFWYNKLCTIVYNIVQDIHHVTFEAGGRQFKAKVYGDIHLEIVSATPNKQ
ncbi:MAG: hypothetical protein IJ762_07860 [Bacteroidaceae bacterium]|nr:hypothetical protein [Bacteroidaceae bacterium]